MKASPPMRLFTAVPARIESHMSRRRRACRGDPGYEALRKNIGVAGTSPATRALRSCLI
jgi:hypothetical protein